MPSSSAKGVPFVTAKLVGLEIKTVLDIGCGSGKLLRRYKQPGQRWVGVEIWEPYVARYRLRRQYDKIVVADARTLALKRDSFDLAFAGDVLEHMTEEQAVTLFTRMRAAARYCVLSIPMGYYPQGTVYGNVYETHVTNHWTPEKVRAAFGPYDDSSITPPIGTFWYTRK